MHAHELLDGDMRDGHEDEHEVVVHEVPDMHED